MQSRILFVEDDAELTRQVRVSLEGDGHIVHACANGASALNLARSGAIEWDLAIFDVTLPGMSGFEIVARIREEGVAKPVIFLTAKGDVADRVKGLSLGGDDYLTKPFSMDELKARLHALLRRQNGYSAPTENLRLPDGWAMNSVLRQLTVRGETVSLQPREWSLLELFLQNEGRVLTKSFLLDQVWDVRFDPGTNVVDAMVCRLRKKVDDPSKHSHVETIRGRGYLFHRNANQS
jgi:DNA-binding response OmpR family regulator